MISPNVAADNEYKLDYIDNDFYARHGATLLSEYVSLKFTE